jgi:hypothetical protein
VIQLGGESNSRALVNAITDASLLILASNTTLVENILQIKLFDCDKITDAGVSVLLDAIARHRLQTLVVQECNQITDTAFSTAFCGLNDINLTRIELRACRQLTNAALLNLANACREITHLSISFAKNVRFYSKS